MASSMKGLSLFISEIRKCKNKEDEKARINKELANIRHKLNVDKVTDGYQKKKYICKVVYMSLLGYKVDFCGNVAVGMLYSNVYSEKRIGYMYVSIVASKNRELINLINASVLIDLKDSANKYFVNLGLQYVANVACAENYDIFLDSIISILMDPNNCGTIKQSCCLALVAFSKSSPKVVLEINSSRITQLLNDKDIGVVHCAVTLVEALAMKNPQSCNDFIEDVVDWLHKIVVNKEDYFKEYSFHTVPNPWLNIKLLKILQLLPYPENKIIGDKLENTLDQIISKSLDQMINYQTQDLNVRIGIMIEAINLVIHYNKNLSDLSKSANFLSVMMNFRNSNFKYLALETMCSMAASEKIKKLQNNVYAILKTEKDTSINRKAIELLYKMADPSNADTILDQLFVILPSIEYSLREELVLKMTILSEKYALDNFVDCILRLISVAGEFVCEEVWFRVIQVVTNNKEIQGKAAKTVFEALQVKSCHENMVRVGAYILGEFGNFIAGDARSSPLVQLKLLETLFYTSNFLTQQMLLTTFIKFCNLYPEVKAQVLEILDSEKLQRHSNVELQQRATEYSRLIKIGTANLLAVVFDEMPHYNNEKNGFNQFCGNKKQNKNKNLAQPIPGSETIFFNEVSPASSNTISSNLDMSPNMSTLKEEEDTNQPIKNDFVSLFGSSQIQTTTLVFQTDDNSSLISPLFQSENSTSQYTQVNQSITNTSAFDNIPSVSNTLLASNFTNIIPEKTKLYNSTSEIRSFSTMTCSNNTAIEDVQCARVKKKSECCIHPVEYKPPPPPKETPVRFPLNQSICLKQGLLFDDCIFQIGFKYFYKRNMGNFHIFYGNKSMDPITDFKYKIINPNPKEFLKVSSYFKKNTLEAQEQATQILDVEAIEEFCEFVQIKVSFIHLSCSYCFKIVLPLALNRFFDIIPITQHQFLDKWCSLGHQCQVWHEANLSMVREHVIQRLNAFGFPHQSYIDNNPDNYASLAAVHTTKQSFETLVRIQPDRPSNRYLVTVKASKLRVATIICNLLKFIL